MVQGRYRDPAHSIIYCFADKRAAKMVFANNLEVDTKSIHVSFNHLVVFENIFKEAILAVEISIEGV